MIDMRKQYEVCTKLLFLTIEGLFLQSLALQASNNNSLNQSYSPIYLVQIIARVLQMNVVFFFFFGGKIVFRS